MIAQSRRDEIRELVITTLNGMGSHFFHSKLTLTNSEEAQYAAGLWYHGSWNSQEPNSAHFIP